MTGLMDAQEFRFNVRFACAWRIVAEVFRRHRPTRDLRVNHLHPGLSAGGHLLITEGPMLAEGDMSKRPSLSLGCGGGSGAGYFQSDVPFGVPRARHAEADSEESDALEVCRALVALESPRRVVDEVDARAGLPVVGPLSPMDRSTFVARVIAGFMEQRAFSPTGWRPSCGWYDTSALGSQVSDWIAAFPEEWRVLRAPKTVDNVARLSSGAARFWLLARTGLHPEPRSSIEPADGPAMVLDMATGRASLAGIDKPPFDLWSYCQSSGGRVRDAVRWVEDRVEVD